MMYTVRVLLRVRNLFLLLCLQQAAPLEVAIPGTFRLESFQQLPVPGVTAEDPVVVEQSSPSLRRVLRTFTLDELSRGIAALEAIALPEANTRAAEHFRSGRFGLLQGPDGTRFRFNPGIVLVKLRGRALVSAVGVEAGKELAAAVVLSKRSDIEFSELDLWQYQAYQPNDPLLSLQWHHGVIHSFQAWDFGFGKTAVRIAIVDTPFQMNHPDLAANTTDGWDIVTGSPVTAATGIEHSTIAAGLAAGVIGNGVGVAGAGNSLLLPVNISDTGDPGRTVISEMYDSVIWAADHGVRVVNMSWTGGDSDTLNAAGAYLREHARGVLVMPAGNLGVPAYTTNQPDIYCVSMTDAADNMSSLSGVQVDFAAPGWGIYSTTIGGGYAYGSGTSYASPLVAGVIAQLFGINPLLGPADAIEILKTTAVDLGPPGWDLWYGWGRIDFGAAAREAFSRLPTIRGFSRTSEGFSVSTQFNPSWTYTLWRSGTPGSGQWSLVQAQSLVNGGGITLTDPAPVDGAPFYRVSVAAQ